MPSASKILSAVEASPMASNQHELHGVAGFKKIFGSEHFHGPAEFVHANGTIFAIADITWYDSRLAHPSRSEHRLYFQSNPVMNAAKAGDRVTVTATEEGALRVLVTPMS